MQVAIKPQEKENLILATSARGGGKKFMELADISYTPLANLRKHGEAEDYIVEKVRAALQTDEVRQLIKRAKAKRLGVVAA